MRSTPRAEEQSAGAVLDWLLRSRHHAAVESQEGRFDTETAYEWLTGGRGSAESGTAHEPDEAAVYEWLVGATDRSDERAAPAADDGSSEAGARAEGESVGDGSPLRARATSQCWERCRELLRTATRPDNPSHVSRSRIQTRTGVEVDENPYLGLTQNKLDAVIRAAYSAHQMPEVLLALWQKEGSARMITAAQSVPGATTAQNAKTLFRSEVYYEDLGADHFLVTTPSPVDEDNVWDRRESAAAGHETHFVAQVRSLANSRLLSENLTAPISAQLSVSGSGSGPYSVQPTVKFYALSLLLVDARFTELLRRTFPQLPSLSLTMNYLQWNMGTNRFREFLASADNHRRKPQFLSAGEPMPLEQWALETAPRRSEWRLPRVNALRFLHYIDSYRPIFAAAMPLIKPGLEDLPPGSNTG